jgi:arylsulfate sulfotransferase
VADGRTTPVDHLEPQSQVKQHVKITFVLKAILAMVLAAACLLTIACDAGSIPVRPPVVTVSSTNNPLVASVNISSFCSGQAMVEFGPTTSYGRSTSWYPISSGNGPTSLLVAGMTASSTYHMRPQIQCSGDTFPSNDLTFTTGAIPASITLPTLAITRPNPALTPTENPGIESINISEENFAAFFADRDGNPIWYYNNGPGNYAFPFKLLPDGNMLLNVVSSNDSTLTEVDLAGNVVRQMDIYALQQKLALAGGFDFLPGGFHHDFLPLANGHLIVLVDCSQNFTNLAGYPGTITVQGDALIDLDENWNPVWGWNSFDFLDVNRHLEGLPDWTHSNTILYSADDGNLLLSMRNQSWILKIDYENGAGSGNIIWHLGYQGDFSLTNDGVPSDDPSLWFSFQHYPIVLNQDGSQTTLAIWDNGDNRFLNPYGEVCINPLAGNQYPACYSRPVIFQVDQSSMVANITWADPLQYFSIWGGSINQFANGNVEYDLNDPAIPPSPNVGAQVQEIIPSSPPQVVWQMNVTAPAYAYRAYRVSSLYNGVTWPF